MPSHINQVLGFMKSIQGKFTIVSILAILAVLALAGVAKWESSNAQHQAQELLLVSTVTQRHMEGDMMHDAIRGDVLGAILAGGKSDVEGVKQAASDLEDHYAKFKENLMSNKQESLPDNIRVLFDDALVALENYHGAAAATISRVNKGQYYEDALADFEEKFEAMEEENESISNEIETWARQDVQAMGELSAFAEKLVVALSLLAVLAAIFIPIYARIKLFKPQGEMIHVMRSMSEGDYDQDIRGSDRSDEIGNIAKALLVFKRNGEERMQLEKEQKDAEIRAEKEKKQAMEDLANRFESKVQGIIQSVAAAATELYQTSESMSGMIDNASQKATSVSKASDETSQNIQTVAASTEQMSASVKEIAQQILRSTEAVNGAVTEMERADKTSQMLEEATKRIGEIVELIQGIAAQINLLALNATIESARAGDAGKGFAVVASEVKQLATQTSKATEEISGSIDNIRNVSEQVIHAMSTIKNAISGVNEISSSISSAVEEQTAVTNEISANMSRASCSTTLINDDIGQVRQAANDASSSATQTLSAARALSQQAESLSQEVCDFLAEVRAG